MNTKSKEVSVESFNLPSGRLEHTPTPWHYDGEYIRTGLNRFDPETKVQIIAEINDTENWEANAAFIVRAVNSHENLLAMMKTAIIDIENGSLGNALSVLRFAIAKAGGK